jgi:hypothetical protein
MDLSELKDKLYWNNVPERWYSLDEGLKPNALHLYKNYSQWEYFFLDDRGERTDLRIFYSDEDAYNFLWKMLEAELKVFKVQPRVR